MAEELIKTLEQAARVVLAPPNLVSVEQRHVAEQTFLYFRKLRSPYQLCNQILETNTNDYILYETISLIKIAIIREWSDLSETDTSSLRDYLLNYVINKPNLPLYVKRNILKVIAIIIKRGSISDCGQSRQCILREIQNLIMTGDLERKQLGCNFISAVMQEYATNSRSTDIGATRGTHTNEKILFQTNDLKTIFKFCIEIINELIKKDLEEDSITFLKHLLPILEDIFTWCFDTSTLLSLVFETWHYMPLYLDKDWEDLMLTPAVIDLMFTLYWKIRENLGIAHHVRTCLVQMVNIRTSTPNVVQLRNLSLRALGITNEDTSMPSKSTLYFTNYMDRFLKFVTNINIIDEEASSIAKILDILYQHPSFNSLPEHMLKSFLEQVSRLICEFLGNALQEVSLNDDYLYTKAVDTLFSIWLLILSKDYKSFSEFIEQTSVQIFNIYLRCHLSPPDGVRNIEDIKREEPDYEDDDRVKFKEHLQIIGTFGRSILNYTLPLLARLIEDQTSKLCEKLNKLMEVGSLNTIKNDSILALYEDIHWLVLMIGHILCREAEGEFVLIPCEIIKYDMRQVQQGKVDMNLTLQYFAQSENVSSAVNITELVDPVVRLIADIFRLCSIERVAMSTSLNSILSPELSCTIIWFLHKWSEQYLLPTETDYSEISVIFLHAFGDDAPGTSWAIDLLLEKVECNIKTFKSEPAVMEETIKLLIALVSNSKKARYTLKSQRFENIIRLATKGQLDLPRIVKRGLMRAVVQAPIIIENKIDENYGAHTLQLLLNRFERITTKEKFLLNYHDEQIRLQIIDILECFIGIAEGARGSEVGSMYRYIVPILNELPNLIYLYHNYEEIVELILELLFESTKGPEPVLRNIPQTESGHISNIFLSTIENYKRCNFNRLTTDKTAEDDNYQDIVLLLKMTTNLLTGVFENERIFLLCLHLIMPMMTTNLMKFPDVCTCYFQMIKTFCTCAEHKVFDLSQELLQQLMTSIELGLFSFGAEISTVSLAIIHDLSREIYKATKEHHPQIQMMAPFLNILISIISSHEVNNDFITSISWPLYYLIRSYPDEYNKILQKILSNKSDEQLVNRLTNVFKTFEQHVNAKYDPLLFETRVIEFVSNVQDLLVVK